MNQEPKAESSRAGKGNRSTSHMTQNGVNKPNLAILGSDLRGLKLEDHCLFSFLIFEEQKKKKIKKAGEGIAPGTTNLSDLKPERSEILGRVSMSRG